MKKWFSILTIVACAFGARASVDFEVESDYGLFFQETEFNDTERKTAAGPFFESVYREDAHTESFRPFFSYWENEEREAKQLEVVWPLYEKWKFDEESNWRALLIFSGKKFDDQDPESKYRFWLMPIYFQGRNNAGDDYLAVFPLGGKLHNFLGRDEIKFALFPLWANSNIGEQKTTSVLWPIYSRTKGPRDDRHRVFPFYGYSERKDQWRKEFIMWPFWNEAEYFGKRDGSAWMFFPFYGRGEVNNEKTTYYLPPLFRFSESPTQTIKHIPWPFFQFAEGEMDKAYFWPIYGTKTRDHDHQKFVIWPIGRYRETQMPEGEMRRWNVVPIWSADSLTNDDGEEISEYWKLWPIMSYRRVGEQSRFRMFELSPIKNVAPIERNWQPFLTVFDSYKDSEKSKYEFLWGTLRRYKGEDFSYFSAFPFYEKQREKESKSWSILKGLIGRETDGENSRWQFLYFFKSKGEKIDIEQK